MNEHSNWNAQGHWRDEERRRQRSESDYSGELDRDSWDRSGATGAATPRSPYRQSQYRDDFLGDRRSHDWETNDRFYAQADRVRGNSSYGQSYSQPYGTGETRDYRTGGADFFTGNDYGSGTRAWNTPVGPGHTWAGGSAGYSGRGGYTGEDDGRGFMDKAVDEVRSWFGDEEAHRRREDDHRGRGPTDYTRSDERIREDANDRLTDDPRVDARQISVTVTEGEVTLTGTVSSRVAKRRAEDCVDAISGVKHVQNNLRVKETGQSGGQAGTLGWGNSDSSVTPSV